MELNEIESNVCDVCKKAVDVFGEPIQLDIAIEECAELIKAISKYKRYCGKESIEDVIEEMADVYIMLNQLLIIFDGKWESLGNYDAVYDVFYGEVANKLERLQLLIDENNKVR